MSLINNMLKDLERREAHAPAAPPIALTTHSSSHPLGMKIIYSVSVLLALLSVVFAIIYLSRHSTSAAFSLPNTAVEITPATAPDAERAAVKPSSITAATIDVNGDATELTFLLDQAPLYRVTSDATQHLVVLTIENTLLNSELPPINFLNTSIDGIAEKNINGDAVFTLTLATGASLKSINFTNTENNPAMIVAITNPNIPAEVESTQHVDKSVKTQAMQNLLLQQYQSALTSAESGHYQIAIQRLTSLLKIDPAYKDARVSLAALLIDQGGALRAKHIINEGLNDNPDFIPYIELKARVLASEGNVKQALATLHTASPALEENPDYHAFIAAMYEENNQHSLAIKLYSQLVQLNSHNGNWWFGLGVALDRAGEDQKAIEAYNKAGSEGHLTGESFAFMETRLRKLQEAIDDKK